MMKKTVFTALVAVLLVGLFSAGSLAQESCPVPAGTKVVLLESSWSFDPEAGLLKGTATVFNASSADAIAPGVMIGLYNLQGEMFDNFIIRGKQARLAPGDKTEVEFHVQLKAIPLSVMISPIEGMAVT